MASPSLLTNKTTGNYSISSSRKRSFESTITGNPSSMSNSSLELNGVNGGFSTAPTSPVDESDIPTKILATNGHSKSNGFYKHEQPTCSKAVEVKVGFSFLFLNIFRNFYYFFIYFE